MLGTSSGKRVKLEWPMPCYGYNLIYPLLSVFGNRAEISGHRLAGRTQIRVDAAAVPVGRPAERDLTQKRPATSGFLSCVSRLSTWGCAAKNCSSALSVTTTGKLSQRHAGNDIAPDGFSRACLGIRAYRPSRLRAQRSQSLPQPRSSHFSRTSGDSHCAS
jgi:hypothetical protein